MMDYLKNHSSTDVKPVIHAKWIDNAHGSDFFGCSNCHHSFNYIDNCTEEFDYCPVCGAKMDEK